MNSDDILENYDGEDVIILGEDHTEDKHHKLEEEAVYRTIPRYVLSEGLNDADPEEYDSVIDQTNLMSLRDIETYFEENYEDSQYLAENTEELYQKTQDIETKETITGLNGEVPETYEEFMDMPFYRMDTEVMELVTDSIQKRTDYEAEEWEKWMGEEEPEGLNDRKIQTLYNIQSTVFEMSHKMTSSQGSLIRPLSHLRQEGYDVELAGCDIDKDAEYSDDSGRHFEQTDASAEELQKQVTEIRDNPEKMIEDFAKDVEFINELTSDDERDRRDQAMAERISQFDQQNNSGRAIMAVVGANHLDGVVRNLQDQEVSVYSEDLREIAEPEDNNLEGMLYAMETAQKMRK